MLMKMVECNLVVFSSTDLQRFIALRSSASVRFTLQLVSIFHNTAIKSGMVRFSNSSESQRGFGTMDELERSCFFRVSLEQSMETCADPWTCVARWLTSPFLFLPQHETPKSEREVDTHITHIFILQSKKSCLTSILGIQKVNRITPVTGFRKDRGTLPKILFWRSTLPVSHPAE